MARGHRPAVSDRGRAGGWRRPGAGMADPAGREAVAAVWRIESARIVGALARYTGDFALAEDLAQEALAEALVTWPRDGVPAQPRRVAAHRRPPPRDRRVPPPLRPRRAVRRPRPRPGRGRRHRRAAPARRAVPRDGADLLWDPDRIDDDVLALMFIACHPVLSREARVALTLRVVGGLTSDEIARAFLVPAATVQARITRAKKTLAAARVPFAVPPAGGAGRAARLGAQRDLPDLHRGLVGELRRRPDPVRPRGRGAAAGAGAGPAGAGRAGGARPAGAARADRGALPRPDRARRRAGAARAAGPPPLGPAPRSAVGAPPWPARSRPAAASARTACRRRSPSATPSPRRSARPTGSASCCSTRRSAGSRRRRWSTSTGRWRSPWPRGRPRRCRSWTSCWPTGALPGSHLLPSVRGELLARLGRDDEARAELSAPRRCAATSASARCCGARSPASRSGPNPRARRSPAPLRGRRAAAGARPAGRRGRAAAPGAGWADWLAARAGSARRGCRQPPGQRRPPPSRSTASTLSTANHAPQASVSQLTRPYPAPSQSRHRPHILAAIWMTPRQVTTDDRSTLPQGCPTAGEDR